MNELEYTTLMDKSVSVLREKIKKHYVGWEIIEEPEFASFASKWLVQIGRNKFKEYTSDPGEDTSWTMVKEGVYERPIRYRKYISAPDVESLQLKQRDYLDRSWTCEGTPLSHKGQLIQVLVPPIREKINE